MWSSCQLNNLGRGERFIELGVPYPVPALNAPVISYLLQLRFWGGAQTREKEMSGTEGFAVTVTAGLQLHYPSGSAPDFTVVRWCLFCSHHPCNAEAVADLVIAYHERLVPLSLKMAADQAMQRLLVPLYRQQELGSLPGAGEKLLLCVERICLDELDSQTQLSRQLFEHAPLNVRPYG